MRERVDTLMGQRAERAHLATFHSFATEILRQHGSHIGLRPDFALLTLEDDRVSILEEAVASIDTGAAIFSGYGNERLHQLKNALILFDRLFAESYDGSGASTGGVQVAPWMAPLFDAGVASMSVPGA